MTTTLFSERLWQRVNDHFRASGQFYVDAPRPRVYQKKAKAMMRHFPQDRPVTQQAAYLAKNLVNLQRYPDANKRTASVLIEFFLETNGYELICTNHEYAEFLLRVQRKVPTEAWDGRTFTLNVDYIPLRDDAYHRLLTQWFQTNTKKKN